MLFDLSIRIDIANSDVPIRMIVYPNIDSAGANISYGTAICVPKAKHAIVGSLNGSGIGKINNYAKSFDVTNLDPVVDDSAQSAVTTNPGSQWFWLILAKPMDDASLYTVTLNITIIYSVVLSQRKLVIYT